MKDYNNPSKTIIMCLLLIACLESVTSLHLSPQHRRVISKECCTLKGGFECGATLIDCCVIPKNTPKQKVNGDLCIKGGLFETSSYCPGQIIKEGCNYCQQQCQEKKGIICGLNGGETDACCLKEDCVPDINFNLKMKKCKLGKEIKLSECVTDMSLSDQVFGKVETIV